MPKDFKIYVSDVNFGRGGYEFRRERLEVRETQAPGDLKLTLALRDEWLELDPERVLFLRDKLSEWLRDPLVEARLKDAKWGGKIPDGA